MLRRLIRRQPRGPSAAGSGWPAARCGWPARWCALGIVTRLDEPDEFGRRFVLTVDLPEDFALNQPLAHFALAAFDVLDPESESYTLDVVSVDRGGARGAAPDPDGPAARGPRRGDRRDEGRRARVRRADGAAGADHLAAAAAELLEALYETYRQTHPWLPEDALAPKSVVREMWEKAMGFTDFVGRYQLARSEGLVLRYLTDAYRTLRHSVPEAHRTPEVEDVIEWLGETVRQTDSSLLDEWEALSDPDHLAERSCTGEPPPPPRPLSTQERVLPGDGAQRACARRVDAVARDDLDALVRLERQPPTASSRRARSSWPLRLGRRAGGLLRRARARLTDGDARGPTLLAGGAERTGEPVGAEEDDPPAVASPPDARTTPRATTTG